MVPGLTEEQKRFLYFVDVVGYPVQRAADLAGISAYEAQKLMQDPSIAHLRQVQKDVVRHRSKITLDDVNEGIRDAIDDAKLVADPMAQIRGWTELARINGLEAPKKVAVEHSLITSPDAPSEQLKQLPSAELAKLVDESHIIDADFYEVRE